MFVFVCSSVTGTSQGPIKVSRGDDGESNDSNVDEMGVVGVEVMDGDGELDDDGVGVDDEDESRMITCDRSC